MPQKKQTVEEVKEQLRAAGLPVGDWKHQPEREIRLIKVFSQSKKVLETAKSLLENEVEGHQRSIAQAYVELTRHENGGGQ